MTVTAKIINLGNIEDDVLMVSQGGEVERLARGESTFVAANPWDPLTLGSEHGNGEYKGSPTLSVSG